MFLRKAMRYYRLWIYTCNAVLLVSVLVFVGVGTGIVSHPYMTLLPVPSAYHPTVLYGYMALILQAGILQAMGCVGALRLSEKLLNTYWLLLLLLLLGDLLVGLIWLIKFTHLTDGVTPFLKQSLDEGYGTNAEVTSAWDSLQETEKCCGINGPSDYEPPDRRQVILPITCCRELEFSIRPIAIQGNQGIKRVLPPQTNPTHRRPFSAGPELYRPLPTERPPVAKNITATCGEPTKVPNMEGCLPSLSKWVKNSAETLMILGFCVITLIKLCFVGILRFEIQEMIQKIKVLQGELTCVPNPELAAALGMTVPPNTSTGGPETSLLGNSRAKENKEALQGFHFRQNNLSSLNDGAESDTNSHCALITDTPVRNLQPESKKNGNNNELTELQELRHIKQTQI